MSKQLYYIQIAAWVPKEEGAERNFRLAEFELVKEKINAIMDDHEELLTAPPGQFSNFGPISIAYDGEQPIIEKTEAQKQYENLKNLPGAPEINLEGGGL